MTGVLQSCEWVACQSASCHIMPEGVAAVAARIDDGMMEQLMSPSSFDSEVHICDPSQPELTTQFLLVVDSLNFCFWQDGEFEYHNLAGGIKAAVLKDNRVIDAEKLASMSVAGLQDLVGWKHPLPLQEERARLLREVGQALLTTYGGLAANLVQAANQSAVRLVELVTAAFPGFRDHAIYKGHQVFFYKRAQIFVGDVWGAFQGRGLGCFTDIGCLSMFADYRVPVVLRELGVLRYSDELARKVDSLQEIEPGSTEEIEIRAATVAAVDQIRQAIAHRLGRQRPAGETPRGGQLEAHAAAREQGCSSSQGEGSCKPLEGSGTAAGVPNSVQLDWWLWEQGEKARHAHRPHHRTLTIWY